MIILNMYSNRENLNKQIKGMMFWTFIYALVSFLFVNLEGKIIMFETIYVNFMLLVVLPLILFMIYVGPLILFFSSIIFVLTRKSIDIFSRILIVIIILLITFLLFITLIKFNDKPSEYYSKMKQINDSKSIVGLSKNEVENKLGEPGKIKETENMYLYDAGTLFRDVTFVNHYDLWVKTYYYALFVYFDENDIVKSISLKESLEFYVP